MWDDTLETLQAEIDALYVPAKAAYESSIDSENSADRARLASISAAESADVFAYDVQGFENMSGPVSISRLQGRTSYIKWNLTGNVQVSLEDGFPDVYYIFVLEIVQKGSGNNQIVFENVRAANGRTPSISSELNAVDVLYVEWNGSEWTVFLGGLMLGIPAGWTI